MTARRVLMTVDAVGGVWSYAAELARELTFRGSTVVLAVIGPRPSDGQIRSARRSGVSLVDLSVALDWTARTPAEIADAGAALAALSARCDADLIHLNHPALGAEARFERPVVAVAHSCVGTWWGTVRGGPMPKDLAWRGALAGKGYRAATRVIAPSGDFAAATERCHALPQRPAIVHNGRTGPARARLAAPPFVLTAGRLWDDGKDVATLDRAAARLGTVTIKAAGPVKGPHGARIALPHLQTLGQLGVRELARLYRSAAIFVSTSRYEPFGLAVLEAAQHGAPLLLADTPVFRELWDGAAVFVPPGDDAALADAIRALLADEPRRRALGTVAIERAARYTAAAMAEGTLAVHAEALARPQRHLSEAAA